MRTLVVVPAYNEEGNIPSVAADLRLHAPWADVCVVDDGSTDDTAAVARRLGLSVLRLPVNLGIGGAVQAGYMLAQERGYDVAVQFDGDGQHDAASLAQLVEPIRDGRADLVVGCRFGCEEGFRSTFVRRLGIRYLSAAIRLRCGARILDATSGYRAAGRAAIALFAHFYPADYPEPEAIALVARAGLRLVETPVRMRRRHHGASSITWLRSVYYFVKVSLALLLLPNRAARPTALTPTR